MTIEERAERPYDFMYEATSIFKYLLEHMYPDNIIEFNDTDTLSLRLSQISNAVTGIPALLARVRELEAENKRMKEALERIATSTMSQHLNKESMIVNLQEDARQALEGK